MERSDGTELRGDEHLLPEPQGWEGGEADGTELEMGKGKGVVLLSALSSQKLWCERATRPFPPGSADTRAPVQAESDAGTSLLPAIAEHQLAPSPSFLTFVLGSALLPICHQHSPFIKLGTSLTSP